MHLSRPIQWAKTQNTFKSNLDTVPPTVTLNVYSHLVRKQNPEAAARLKEAIFKMGTNLAFPKRKGSHELWKPLYLLLFHGGRYKI
jgi:hypothetical protein